MRRHAGGRGMENERREGCRVKETHAVRERGGEVWRVRGESIGGCTRDTCRERERDGG